MTQDKKLFIKTWGCQMNVYDSNRMADVLAPLGYKTVDQPEGADMIILNTCHIREKATDKVFSEIGRLKAHKKAKEAEGGKMLMAVAGCVAQAEGDFILERAPVVDMVFGPQTYHELPEMVAKATGAFGKNRPVHTELTVENKFDRLPEEHVNVGPASFLSVQEGCDKFCTFCVVPYTRGAEFSRPMQAILDEAKRLIDHGTKEITLLGQNVNAWHGDGLNGNTSNLGELIAEIAKLDISRIRYTTSHPRDVDDALIDAHRNIDALMPYLHLPVQSGSDKILKAMNRKHTSDEYKAIMDRFREARPDISFSGDFIVGFPGETEEDFQATMDVVNYIEYGSAYSFKYSPRPGTPAANMGGLVREQEKDERLQRLQALITEKQLKFNKSSEGLTLPVLFERKGGREGQIQGRTPYNQSINCDGNERLIGEIVDVRITEGFMSSVTGDIETVERVISL
ncbi:MAG: tRNA (N6-isopentenyl adenosine(37)-C2)-methylthiotransferase MiaB [Pseudomonadota bacterium]